MMGPEIVEPRAPVLFNVKVPPWTSVNVSFLVLARSAKSLAAIARPEMLS